jgi:hypothetical protein
MHFRANFYLDGAKIHCNVCEPILEHCLWDNCGIGDKCYSLTASTMRQC